MFATRHPVQLLTFIVGIVYLLLGVAGFLVTGFGPPFAENGPEALLGVLDVNPVHNLIHAAVGAVLIVASIGTPSMTQGFLIGGGAVLVLAAILGFADLLPILSIDESLAVDNFLHLVSGLAAVLLGLLIGERGPAPDMTSQPDVTPRGGGPR